MKTILRIFNGMGSGKRDLGKLLRTTYHFLSKLPGGKWAFSKMIGYMAPYSGTIGARVVELRPGFARIRMKERWRVRNHLRSVHAVALMNLAEMATGLAISFGLPEGTRGILKGLSIEYFKKARGVLTAECQCDVTPTAERREYSIVGRIFNVQGELVAQATALWLIGPEQE